jgi:subtilisin-like proprotein convertase family protein
MKRILLPLLLIIFVIADAFSQPIWRIATESQITSERLVRDSHPNSYLLYSLDLEALKAKLHNAPSRNIAAGQSAVIIAFPNPQGEMQNFRIFEASVMHPDLAARHQGSQSYVGIGVEDRTAMIRFSVTLFGLHTMTFSGINGTSYIDPYSKDLKNYMVYSRSVLTSDKIFSCGVSDDAEMINYPADDMPLQRSNNSLFKTYRLALSCTIEYAAFHYNAAGLGSGTIQQKKDAVLAAMVVTMTRVNGVYERELALTMVMIPNNEDIINITSDNLDNFNSPPDYPLLGQNQTETDATIGDANYDIGHVCSTGGGGVATLQSPCVTGNKARGVTGLTSPVGDPYDIDYVAHEMGHQWGGSHTFNSDQGSCNGNRSTSSSYEPGSGTTIMAYAGICAPHDVQQHSDDYMHARSLIQMMAYINAGGNCGVILPNGNTPPTVSAGSNCTIPFGTAFKLHGTASDVDNPSLTYCWEQYNAQVSTQPPVATSLTGPNFRSYNPTALPDRYFPKFTDVFANNLTPTWEVVPNVARSMVFSLVVRDNQSPNGGQTERATMTLTYANTGPFKVTSQNSAVAWAQNAPQTVTWDVAGTDANGINTSQVNILMSVDGGLTFPIVLAANTANDGSEVITAPDMVSQTCRLMVQSVGNVFYAVNTTPFSVGDQIVSTCNTYTYNTPFTLPDGSSSYTVKTINVPTSGVINDVNITINATHPNLQNLLMAVIRPGGTLQTLFNQQCSGNADMNVTFDAQGAPFACASPTTGTYVPPTGFNLNTLNGFNPQGNWQFGFKDLVATDTGTINSITLEVCTQQLFLAAKDFEFENFALYPNPNNGNFTVQFNSKSSGNISISVHDMRGRKIFDKHYTSNGLFSENLQLNHAQSGVFLGLISVGVLKTVNCIVLK